MIINSDSVPKSIDNAVQNITDKPTKEIGTTLGDIWFLVFGPLSKKAEEKRIKYSYELEQYKNRLESQIALIPEEKKIEPSIQITAQALEASKYCVSSAVLREMFVNLISGTMNKDFENSVHPSFPEILKQLSEKDARLLMHMANVESLPVIDIKLNNANSTGYQSIAISVMLPFDEMSSEECTLSASALERAGLLTISTGLVRLADSSQYEAFKSLPQYKEAEQIAKKNGGKVDVAEGICRLSNLGHEFIKVCVR